MVADYYHRSLQDIFNVCFQVGFVTDGFCEECYGEDKENKDYQNPPDMD